MDISTIDQKIRANAKEEYAAEIEREIKQFSRKFFTSECGGARTLVEKPGNGNGAYWCSELLSSIGDALLKRFGPEKEEAAVREFLKKVESLGEEVEALRNSIDR